MKPIVKKAAAALAIKEIVDRVQEARQPKKSFIGRNKGKALWAALIGGGAYLYKTGRIGPLVDQAKSLAGRGTGSSSEPAAYPTGPTLETHGPMSDRPEADRTLEPSHN